jgi:23S rRNA (cytosine1962-C5)-methyltransferase
MQTLAAGRRVLNVFGYTGGFSVYAGLGGARHVTTVDLAGPALEVAERHWRDNNLPEADHTVIVADAFIFLDEAAQRGDLWDLVILDPPSFAPARKAVPKALAAYRRLIAAGATVTIPQGLLAAASCSSHIDLSAFLNACEGGIAKARRRATILSISGQPPDHPAPLVLPEFRYLKFILMRLE